MSTIPEWTVEELVAELKRRERRGRSAAGLEAAGGGARSIAAPSRPGDLDRVSTAALARMAQDQQRVVYGVDDRKDMFQVTNAKIRKASEAVVALVKGADLDADGNGGWTLATTSYEEEFQLCPSEAFASQPLGCFCSGFLVRPDVIVTAGHCVKSAADLAKMRFVFGFRMIDSSTPRTSFGADDVYEGAALIGRKLTQDRTDWAVVRAHLGGRRTLPRPLPDGGEDRRGAKGVCNRSPMRTSAEVRPRRVRSGQHTLGIFRGQSRYVRGNSGSPVFNATDHKVEGILVRGENDFVTNGSCFVSLVCPTTGCRGEDVTRCSEWAGKVPKPKRRQKKSKKSSARTRGRRR